ncbi:MAG TPA: hypothetical protein PKD83_13380 [Ignavibacteria bacterium]|nr:hypothetical protein [Ignavibacteria bacterium]
MVPLLITMDLETASDHNINEQNLILKTINSDFSKLNLSLTTFLTSDSLDRFNESLQDLNTTINEFGIHGFDHSVNENYILLSEEEIRLNIEYAFNNIRNSLNRIPEAFRGPFMSTSSLTQKVLTEKKIRSDFSVCSQRMDFMNSRGGSVKWLFSPRLPYHPSEDSPYKAGELPLWVVPLSCIGFPFISSMLYIFGLNFMKAFYRILLKESIATKKPIVYLFHSYEFTADVKLKRTELKNHNNSFLHNFYINDIKRRYELNLSLIRYMLSFDSVCPMNSSQYINFLERNSD